MKRVLFVSPGFSYGGSTTALLSILNSTLSQEYKIGVFSLVRGDNHSPELMNKDIGLNEWTNAFYSNFADLKGSEKLKAFFLKVFRQIPILNKKVECWIIKKTIKRIDQYHYDCVVAFQEKLATEFCQYFPMKNKIAWLHCDYAKAFPRTERDLEIYEKYKHIICVSKATRESFLGYFPVLTARTVAIYNLFDEESIKAKSLCKIDDSRFDKSEFTIISVGRLNRVKRFDLIPQIAHQLLEKGAKFRWYIIGQPYNEEEKNRLKDAINEYDNDDKVVYLGGKDNPYPYFRAANLLVSTSESEACPMIFNEAKLLGLPIVSTDFPSAYEFINEPSEGRISSIEMMADSIYSFMKDILSGIVNVPPFNASESNSKIITEISNLFDS